MARAAARAACTLFLLLSIAAARASAWRLPAPLLRAAASVPDAAPEFGAADVVAGGAGARPQPSRRSDTLLNVHLVAHTHDDVGWCARAAARGRVPRCLLLARARRSLRSSADTARAVPPTARPAPAAARKKG
jgi:hypothetical protein